MTADTLPLLTRLPNPGFVRLAMDVSNPKPDRRRRRDWRCAPVWVWGTVLQVECMDGGMVVAPQAVAGRTRTRVRVRQPGRHSGLEMVLGFPTELDGPRILALLAHAEPMSPTIADVMGATVYDPVAILEALAQMGKITVADVQAAIARLDDPEAP